MKNMKAGALGALVGTVLATVAIGGVQFLQPEHDQHAMRRRLMLHHPERCTGPSILQCVCVWEYERLLGHSAKVDMGCRIRKSWCAKPWRTFLRQSFLHHVSATPHQPRLVCQQAHCCQAGPRCPRPSICRSLTVLRRSRNKNGRRPR